MGNPESDSLILTFRGRIYTLDIERDEEEDILKAADRIIKLWREHSDSFTIPIGPFRKLEKAIQRYEQLREEEPRIGDALIEETILDASKTLPIETKINIDPSLILPSEDDVKAMENCTCPMPECPVHNTVSEDNGQDKS